MKWINDVLRLNTHQWTEADTWINAPLSNAITHTYDSIINQREEQITTPVS